MCSNDCTLREIGVEEVRFSPNFYSLVLTKIIILGRNTLRKSCPDLERELEKEKIRQRLEQDSEEIGWGLEGGFASRTKKARQKRENAEWMKKDLTVSRFKDVLIEDDKNIISSLSCLSLSN